VIEQLGYTVAQKYLNVINSDYERIGDLDYDRVFKIIDFEGFPLFNSTKKANGQAYTQVTVDNFELVIEREVRSKVETTIIPLFEKDDLVNLRFLLTSEIEDPVVVHKGCFSPHVCPFQGYCFKKAAVNLTSGDSIFDLRGGSPNINQKLTYFHDDIKTLRDVKPLIDNQKTLRQIDAQLSGLEYFDNYKVTPYLKLIAKTDLYHLDFETFQQPIPK